MNDLFRPDRPFHPWLLGVVAILVIGVVGACIWGAISLVWAQS